MDARLAAQGLSPVADDGPRPTGPSSTSPPIDYQDAYYYAAPKAKPKLGSLDEVDPEILRVYEKLGIPIEEQKVLAGVEGARKVAVDAVFDSVSVATTFRAELERAGVIFRSISEAVREYPDLVRKWLGKVVPMHDNYFAALNAAVFSDGTFVYIPEGVRCPMELSTYFRINAANTGQFERTLIVADKGSYVSYLEGCTAPMRDENQLHAAVVELVAMDDAEIKYSTVQNWYPGDAEGLGGIYNFVTKRALCQGKQQQGVSGRRSRPARAITWKYPSCVLAGENSVGEFYSVAVTNNRQQADTGTKMIHLGKGIALDDRVEGDQRRPIEQHLSRAGPRRADRGECPQLHPVRFAAARRPSAARTPCPISRCATRRAQIEHEATTSQDQRRPAVLRDAARAERGGCGGADRQRLRQGSAAAAADGVRGRGAEAAGDFSLRGAWGERCRRSLTAFAALASGMLDLSAAVAPRCGDACAGSEVGRRNHVRADDAAVTESHWMRRMLAA